MALPENRIIQIGAYKGSRMCQAPLSYLKRMHLVITGADEEIERREKKLIAMKQKRATIVLQRRGK